MGRMRPVIAGIGVIMLGLATFVGIPHRVPAQDTIEDRVGALETQVADQDVRIDTLESQIDLLREEDQPSNQGSNPTPVASPPDGQEGGAISLSGDGSGVYDKFNLPEGRYKVTATVEVIGNFDGFIVHAFVGDEEHYLFNEIVDEPGTWTGSTILQAREGGETFVEVSNTDSAWTLIFERY